MYKKILVNIPTERSPRPVIDGAISLAARCKAELDAVSVGYESSSMPLVAEGGAAVAVIFEAEREKALERANAALAVFEAEAKQAGVVHSSRAISALQGEAAAILGATARLYDLNVVAQPEFERDTFDNTLAQEILFQSGGPVLFMPYTFKGAFHAKRVGICWDGSRVAARAVRDAMPLLEKAEAITIITINADNNVPAEASAANLVRYLSGLGVPTEIDSLKTEKANIQSSILSLASDESLNLLVMGGYGHSRLKETVFGGVTREMLESMTVPTLMSH
ncbi:universal stress protein [Bradyrhizobium sp.]|uniref:universal stress protein n=1 Tax=Bradyrhizobium sp. TaxID=376 RepID=UPI001DAE4C68|nr:universal stress protein [Bradyrhizobium sp.]MBI5318416.1 universal stress protein [Bradyrhizobium sp.]